MLTLTWDLRAYGPLIWASDMLTYNSGWECLTWLMWLIVPGWMYGLVQGVEDKFQEVIFV